MIEVFGRIGYQRDVETTKDLLLDAYADSEPAQLLLEDGGVPESVELPPEKDLVEAEVELLKKIEELPAVVERCVEECQMHFLANYSFDLCQTFGDFYRDCPVLKSGEPVRTFRLGICAAFKATLATCLGIMGIKATERM